MKKITVLLLMLVGMTLQAQKKESAPGLSNQVVHHVFFYLKNPEAIEQKQQLKEGLKTLRAIKEVRKLLIGEPASTLKREVVVSDWHISEIIYFDDISAQDAYQVDPIHQRFVENYSHLWEKVVVYDMLVDE
ncbi:MAG: Dabb family protein [Flavobacteriaceae bacterium]